MKDIIKGGEYIKYSSSIIFKFVNIKKQRKEKYKQLFNETLK